MRRTTLTARTPEDLIALAPVVLGFQPEESLVLLTFGDGAFHARIDLPSSATEVAGVVDAVLQPMVVHGLRRAVFLVFSARPPRDGLVAALIAALTTSCREAGITVVDALHADGRRWRRLGPAGAGPAVPYDVHAHPFLAQSVVQGRVTWSSRSALAESLAPDPDRIAAVLPLLTALPVGVPPGQLAAERSWLLASIAAQDPLPPPDVCARVLRDLADRSLWEDALFAQTRERADSQGEWWTWVLRSAPPTWVAGPASLLGFVSWLGGQGALAWCAVDRCLAESPEDDRARALADLLVNAVAPRRWQEVLGADVQDPA